MTRISERTARLLLGAVLPIIIAAAGLLPMLLISDLPERFASHFDGAGRPDGSMSLGELAAATGVMMAIGFAMMIGVALYRKPLPWLIGPTAAGIGAFVAAQGAAIATTTVVEQRDLVDWQDAELSGSTLAIVLGAALLALIVAVRIAATLPVGDGSGSVGEQPTMTLADGERTVWTTTHTSPLMYALGLGLLATLVAVAVVGVPWIVLVVLLVASIAVLALASVRVRADRNGLHVNYGLLPWPVTHLGLDEIASASVIDVKPMEWGGWGYRGSLRFMTRAAVVHRAGPGLRVDLHNGKVFAVTVDNPEPGAALLNAEAARQTASV